MEVRIIYSPLDEENQELRLIRILPSQDPSASLECFLDVISLRDFPIYYALSYVWGDQSRTVQILVNHHPVNITENLAAALTQLRSKGFEGPLWADAISINQNDVKDKSHQLPMMRDIFAGAVTTIIWLGPESDDSSLAFNLFRKFGLAVAEATKVVKEDILALKDHPGEEYTNPTMLPTEFLHAVGNIFDEKAGDIFERRLSHGLQDIDFEAVASLWTRSYWRRIWIMQEYVLSKNILLLCGSKQISSHVFEDALKAIQTPYLYGLSRILPEESFNGIAKSKPPSSVSNLIALRATQSASHSADFGSLWDLVLATREHNASNPLDHIYGILGFLETTFYPISIDYSLSPGALFTQITEQFLKDPSIGLKVVSLLGTGVQPNENILSKPSWVPDYSNPACLLSSGDDFVDCSDWPISSTISINETHLFAKGVICDKVAKILKWNEDPVSTFDEWLLEAINLGAIHPTGLPSLQVFFRTMAVDKSGNGYSINEFRSDMYRWAYYSQAIAFMEVLSWSARRNLGEKLPKTTEIPERTDGWISLLSNYLESGQVENFLSLSEVEVSCQIRGFALWLVTGPLQLKQISLDYILESFTGHQSSASHVSWPDKVDSENYSSTQFWQDYIIRSSVRKDSFFTTPEGYFGLGPQTMQRDDLVCCMPGCPYPVVVRPIKSESQSDQSGRRLEIIGACYIYGMMNGEMSNHPTYGQSTEQLIFR
ncbi:HET-domain-containing protein [Microthyrium microscopicum]|uniref:HET-domain-containing protein n=1 Tax=Microthyrium microscopicum TaxID=703497 RepID=A0A6A6U0A2_9PEZI|nr:HET-domain-containing protein [Microthyrium microscopicum]